MCSLEVVHVPPKGGRVDRTLNGARPMAHVGPANPLATASPSFEWRAWPRDPTHPCAVATGPFGWLKGTRPSLLGEVPKVVGRIVLKAMEHDRAVSKGAVLRGGEDMVGHHQWRVD